MFFPAEPASNNQAGMKFLTASPIITVKAPVLRGFINFLKLRRTVQGCSFLLRTRPRTNPSALTRRPGLLQGEAAAAAPSLPPSGGPAARRPMGRPLGRPLARPSRPPRPRQHNSRLPVLPPPAAACPAASPGHTPGWFPSPSPPAAARLATVTLPSLHRGGREAAAAAGPCEARPALAPSPHALGASSWPSGGFGGAPVRSLAGLGGDGSNRAPSARDGCLPAWPLMVIPRQLFAPKLRCRGCEKMELGSTVQAGGAVFVLRVDGSTGTSGIPCRTCGAEGSLCAHAASSG